MPLQLECDYRFSLAIKERLKRQCSTPYSYFTSSYYPHNFVSGNYSDLPKLRPPKTNKLIGQQVRESPPDVQPLDLTKLGQHHSVQQMPQIEVTEFLCASNQIVCVKHDKGSHKNTLVLASLQDNV